MKKIYLLSIIVPLLVACSHKPLQEGSVEKIKHYPVKDTYSLDILMAQFSHNIENIWGIREVLIAGPQDYVKYANDLQTRAHVNFDSGLITIEALESHSSLQNLKKKIVETILMSSIPSDIVSPIQPKANPYKKPLLLGQVIDQDKRPIETVWRASRFADYVLNHNLFVRFSGGRKIYCVTIHLVNNHLEERAKQFLPYIRKASRKYGVDESLILSIIKIESYFNPYAISRSSAIGLMQVQSHTAGRDIFAQWGLPGEPSRSYLLNPEKNINIGTAYLALLKNTYLTGIRNPLSMRYAIITSYNGGAGSVLRVFSADKREAIDKINQLTPEQLYSILMTQHPSLESRNYLRKVHETQQNYTYVPN